MRLFQTLVLILSMIVTVHATTSTEKELKGNPAAEQSKQYQAAFAPCQAMHKEGKYDIKVTLMPKLEPILDNAIAYVAPVVKAPQKVRFETSCAQVKKAPLTLMNFYAFHFLLADIIDQSRSSTPTPLYPPEFGPLLHSFEFTTFADETAKIFGAGDFDTVTKAFGGSKLARQLTRSKFPFLAVLYCASGQIPIKVFGDAAFATEGLPIHLAALATQPCPVHGGILAKSLAFLLHDFIHKDEFDDYMTPADFAKVQTAIRMVKSDDRLTHAFRFYIPHEVDFREFKMDGDPDPRHFLANVCVLTRKHIMDNTDMQNRLNTAFQRQVALLIGDQLGEDFFVKIKSVQQQSEPNVYSASYFIYHSSQAEPLGTLAVNAALATEQKQGNHTATLNFNRAHLEALMTWGAALISSLEGDVKTNQQYFSEQQKRNEEWAKTDETYLQTQRTHIATLEKQNAAPQVLESSRTSLATAIKTSEETAALLEKALATYRNLLNDSQQRLEAAQKQLLALSTKLLALQNSSPTVLVPGFKHLHRFYIPDFVKLLHFMDPSLKDKIKLDSDPSTIRAAGTALLDRFEKAALGTPAT